MYIERDITRTFKLLSETHKIVAVVGPRQAGKTTFLKEQLAGIPNSQYIYMDDPDSRKLFNEDIKKFEMMYVQDKSVTVIDEVQLCDNPGMGLKYLADSGHRLWITSSSQILLEKKVISLLVGRVGILNLYQFSMNEFFRAKGLKEYVDSMFERAIWENISFGGYPEVILEENIEKKKLILKNLFSTILLKDAVSMFSINEQGILEDLAKYFSFNNGLLVSYENVANELKISFQTLKKYIDALEKSYIIRKVRPFFTNKSKELVKQPKIYFLDTGLANAASSDFSFIPEKNGALFESYVLSELVKNGFNPKYWRTKGDAEVDFIIELEKEIIPIEVKIFSDGKTVGKSIYSFIEDYEARNAYIVFFKGEKGEKISGKTNIRFLRIDELITALTKKEKRTK